MKHYVRVHDAVVAADGRKAGCDEEVGRLKVWEPQFIFVSYYCRCKQ